MTLRMAVMSAKQGRIEPRTDVRIDFEDLAALMSEDEVSDKTINLSSGTAAGSNILKNKRPSEVVLEDACNSSREQNSLVEYTPKEYGCILEGALLANGDLKGSWRTRREDTGTNEFLMVLMDRGTYDGGFNIRMPSQNDKRSTAVIEEVHDKWHFVHWCRASRNSSNIWGRGYNVRFGECWIVGSHEPEKRRVVLYKVNEAEMTRAQKYAGAITDAVSGNPPVLSSSTRLPSLQGGQAGPNHGKRTQDLRPQDTHRSSTRPRVVAISPTSTGEASCQSKRHPSHEGSGEKPLAASTIPGSSSLSGNAEKKKQRIYPPGHPAHNLLKQNRFDQGHVDCSTKLTTNGGIVVGAASGLVSSDSEGSSSENNAEPSAEAPSNREVSTQPRRSEQVKGHTSPVTLPGFSGFREDEADTKGAVQESHDDIADLAARASRLKKEKIEITEKSRALAACCAQAKIDVEKRINKAKVDESIMMKALEDLRHKMEEDESQVERISARAEVSRKDEQRLLKAWNERWEQEVAPFIEQHEKEVKKKAVEVERRRKEAEEEKQELDKEFARLHTVKKIADLDSPGTDSSA